MAGALDALRALAAGTYRDGNHAEPIGDANVANYRQCVERLNYMQVSAQGIRWSDLDAKLRLFHRTEGTLFDVTALKKNLLVDVVVLLLSHGEPQIWTFELIKKPTYGKEDLIHAMIEGQDYKYHCITDGKHVEMATKRMLARSLTFRTLLFITGAILVPVSLVEILLPNSWIQSALVGVGTAISIASWFLVMKRQ